MYYGILRLFTLVKCVSFCLIMLANNRGTPCIVVYCFVLFNRFQKGPTTSTPRKSKPFPGPALSSIVTAAILTNPSCCVALVYFYTILWLSFTVFFPTCIPFVTNSPIQWLSFTVFVFSYTPFVTNSPIQWFTFTY